MKPHHPHHQSCPRAMEGGPGPQTPFMVMTTTMMMMMMMMMMMLMKGMNQGVIL